MLHEITKEIYESFAESFKFSFVSELLLILKQCLIWSVLFCTGKSFGHEYNIYVCFVTLSCSLVLSLAITSFVLFYYCR